MLCIFVMSMMTNTIKTNVMQQVKFIKTKSNDIDFDTMTLVNIVNRNGQMFYYFICEFAVKFRGKLSIEKSLTYFNEDDMNYISDNYKIA